MLVLKLATLMPIGVLAKVNVMVPCAQRTWLGVRMNVKAIVVAIAALSVPQVATATTMMECGASHGWFYYLADGMAVSDNDEGWLDDAISGGSLALTVSPNDEFDILFRDADGIKSATAQGANVVPIGTTETTITLVVVYSPAVSELYTFDLNRRVVLWSQHKFTGLIDKAGSWRAECE